MASSGKTPEGCWLCRPCWKSQVQAPLATYADRLAHEIVAFPQHGLLRTKAKGLVREALRQGATHIGGVDPAQEAEEMAAVLREAGI